MPQIAGAATDLGVDEKIFRVTSVSP